MSFRTSEDKQPVRVLALMEATTVTGPAKNLIEFCRRARALGSSAGDPPAAEITFVTFHRGPGADGPEPNAFVAAARAAGVGVEVIPERFRFDPRVLSGLRRLVSRRQPDIIQSHMVKSHFLVKLSGLWRRRPWVAFHHGYTTTDRKMELYNRLDRWSLPAADRVVTVCGAFAEQLARVGVRPEKVFVRHNSINADGAAPSTDARELKSRLGIGEGERVVLAVGRLSREKGHVDLVGALGRLRGVNFRLVIVGDGPERPAVERAAGERAISDRVVFAGHVSDVRPFYAMADLLALPSHSEGSPNVLLEAMASGLPVVATSVGGVPEIVAHEESALLVGARDEEAMAASIARMLRDAPLARRLAARSSELIAEHYTPDAYARSVAGLYRAVRRGREA
ncbi:MAG TPA: glycosyltransferase [Pyrinomonadaceae bacterium]|jgi:glycosyltransferase involved in cell wall biosynthesis|nr:glycosyltransferase [Pyrinomonadaceae bacterium]